MAFVPSSPITGGAQSIFTSPTYTIVADSNPAANAKQYYVSAIGGTQAGVVAHSVAAPFTLSMFKPTVLKTLGPVNPATGQLRNVPTNTYKVHTRKGVLPLAGQPYRTARLSSEFEVPAGADLADVPNLRAMISAHVGLLNQLSNELGNSVTTGTI